MRTPVPINWLDPAPPTAPPRVVDSPAAVHDPAPQATDPRLFAAAVALSVAGGALLAGNRRPVTLSGRTRSWGAPRRASPWQRARLS
jgi:hypothetical protein